MPRSFLPRTRAGGPRPPPAVKPLQPAGSFQGSDLSNPARLLLADFIPSSSSFVLLLEKVKTKDEDEGQERAEFRPQQKRSKA